MVGENEIETNPVQPKGIANLAKALAAAQGEMLVPKKNRTAKVQMRAEKGGGTYEYKYADLSDIREAITPALSKHGLCVLQPMDGVSMILKTLLIHESGEGISSTYELPRGLPAQQFGSALTYARRYSLCSLLGVVAEDDTDAQIGQYETQRNSRNQKSSAAMAKITGKPAVAPKSVGGTSRPALAALPPGCTRQQIDQRIKECYLPMITLNPNIDLSAEIMGRYGAQTRAAMTDEEAFDFMQWMFDELQKGASA